MSSRRPALPELLALWNEHLNARFPQGAASLDPAGVCLASTDTFMAGCLTSFFGGSKEQGHLDSRRSEILASCRAELERALEAEMPPHIRTYFQRLFHLAGLVLAHLTRE